MIALYSADGRSLARITAALAGSTVVSTDRWDQFERAIPTAACSIVVVEWLPRSPVFLQLTLLKARFPRQPIVLVTSKDADNGRALLSVPAEEVVRLSEVHESGRSRRSRPPMSSVSRRNSMPRCSYRSSAGRSGTSRNVLVPSQPVGERRSADEHDQAMASVGSRVGRDAARRRRAGAGTTRLG